MRVPENPRVPGYPVPIDPTTRRFRTHEGFERTLPIERVRPSRYTCVIELRVLHIILALPAFEYESDVSVMVDVARLRCFWTSLELLQKIEEIAHISHGEVQ